MKSLIENRKVTYIDGIVPLSLFTLSCIYRKYCTAGVYQETTTYLTWPSLSAPPTRLLGYYFALPFEISPLSFE